MPKFTVKKGEEEIEVEIGDKELVEKLDFKNESVFSTILEKIGLKKKEQKEQTTTETEGEVQKNDELIKGLKELLEPITQDMTALKETMNNFKAFQQEQEKSATEQRVDSLLNKAVSEGRIAKGEIETFKKKFTEKYNSDTEVLEEILNGRQIDEKIRTENQRQGAAGTTQDKDNEQHGTPSFSRKQIADSKFYEEHRDDIMKAQEAGTITD